MAVEIKVPDIGDFKDVPIIEVHVAAGSSVGVEEPLITLESDKATMDVPAPQAGTIVELRVKPGDRVSEGSVILLLEPTGAAATPPKQTVVQEAEPEPTTPPSYGSPSGVYDTIEVAVPDIGDFNDVPIIEVHVSPGAKIAADDPLITLESDKASMEVPSPAEGNGGGTAGQDRRPRFAGRCNPYVENRCHTAGRTGDDRHAAPGSGGTSAKHDARRHSCRGAGARRRTRRLHRGVPCCRSR